ncbi:T9SS type A sorting domain-containing protein [Spirosoma validum]|uniref:T9SS type A sorting domain-containing protein n=1 Tax=Spirosoma validum TaxID=2771355 RepID=A0A927GFN8_9BACT|nr:T9SS type A sorting domain-containing protein [Spirosoma validum]MBD2756127.1 T9SS type A sorting domain-containing protein [Spirosoma validum]
MSGSAVVCISGAGKISGNLNGGTVIYNGSTASDPINLGNLGGGTLRIRSSVTLNNLTAINSGSTLIVENNAKLTVSSIDVNGTLIVDRAVLYVNNALGINSNGGVCFNNGIVDVSQFRSNDQTNSSKVISASAKGCYVVRNGFNNFNQSLTNTSNVSICLPGNTAPNNTGSATLNYSCAGGGGCYAALPVRLVSFQAQSVGEGVRLDWTTSMEKDFDYFQVERGTDATSFEAISPQIKSLGGQEDNRKYSWTDVDAKNGTFYYRLKQVDLDKSVIYSKIVGVTFDGENKGVLITPNPFSNELSITLNSPIRGNYIIELYSTSGQLHATAVGEKTGTVTTQTLTTNTLPAGFYFANIRLGDQYFVRKVIKP